MKRNRASAIPMASVDTLVRLAECQSERRHWYSDARTELAKVAAHFDVGPVYTSGVAAALSPRASVRRSMRLLGMHLRGWTLPPDVYKQKRLAVQSWDNGCELGGQKVRAFYANLVGNEDAVVLDTWMAKAMMPTVDRVWPSRGGPLVDRATDRIKEAAAILRWTPAQVQAAIWCGIYLERRVGALPPRMLAQDAIEVPDA